LRKQTFQTIIRKVATYGKFISSDNKRALTLPTEMVLKGKKKKRITFSDRVSVIHHISRVREQIRLISWIKVACRLDG